MVAIFKVKLSVCQVVTRKERAVFVWLIKNERLVSAVKLDVG